MAVVPSSSVNSTGSGLIWCIRFAVRLRSAIRTYWQLQPISCVDFALNTLNDFLEYICINEQNDVIARSDYGRSARRHKFTGASDNSDNDFVWKVRCRIPDFTIRKDTFFSNL